MGVDAGDFDDDGDEDLFVTNLSGEGHDLYVNDGAGTFESRSAAAGLKFPTLPFTGFGAAWLDVDNDGWLDLLTVNGTIQRIDALARTGDPLPLRQRKQLFHNLGNAHFEEVSEQAGDVFRRLDVGRGAAFGDLDNDGDTDVIVANNNGAAQVLLNTIGARNHWMGLRLVGRVSGQRRGSGHARCTRRGTSQWFAVRDGAVRGQTEASRRRTIRACSSASAAPANSHTSGSPGRTVASKSGRVSRSIDTPR